MRVAYTSDLHADVTKSNRLLVPYLARRVSELTPDIFALAGDVASSLAALDDALAQFVSLDCLKVMVPGNAVWNDTRYAVWLRHPDSGDWRQRRMTLGNDGVFGTFYGELQSAVRAITASVDKLLLVLHTAPFQECITPKPEPSPCDAYEGSSAIGEFIEREVAISRQVWVICGHRHKPLFLQRGILSALGLIKQ